MVAALLALFAAASPPACPAGPPPSALVPPGEQLRFKLDVLGAEVGTFDAMAEATGATSGGRKAALELRGRAKTNAFVSTNLGEYYAVATALLAPDLTPLHYKEEIDEGQTHKAADIDFPPRSGHLPAEATLNGNPDPLQLDARSPARDMLSTLYVVRAQPLQKPVCFDVYAARKMWRIEGRMAGREQIETPLGKFASLRFDGAATRLDDATVQRAVHIWVTDDARRLPLVAMGEVKGKTFRAQLVEATGAGVARRAPKQQQEQRGTPRVGAAIGR
jgi:Protein of unknown function (DUF3108)